MLSVDRLCLRRLIWLERECPPPPPPPPPPAPALSFFSSLPSRCFPSGRRYQLRPVGGDRNAEGVVAGWVAGGETSRHAFSVIASFFSLMRMRGERLSWGGTRPGELENSDKRAGILRGEGSCRRELGMVTWGEQSGLFSLPMVLRLHSVLNLSITTARLAPQLRGTESTDSSQSRRSRSLRGGGRGRGRARGEGGRLRGWPLCTAWMGPSSPGCLRRP